MTTLLDDYTKADFPLEVNWRGSGHVRLYAAFGDKVIGASYYPATDDCGESLAQVLNWDGQGVFANGQYPEMNLPPPPANVAERINKLKNEIASAQSRLDANPDAPQEWRSIDERTIKRCEDEIARLTGRAQ